MIFYKITRKIKKGEQREICAIDEISIYIYVKVIIVRNKKIRNDVEMQGPSCMAIVFFFNRRTLLRSTLLGYPLVKVDKRNVSSIHDTRAQFRWNVIVRVVIVLVKIVR